MIKLTLKGDSDEKTFHFNKKEIIIGSNPQADLSLNFPSVQPIHFKIIQEELRCLVFNSSNDPFASLNGIPFGKKMLRNNDIISSEEFSIECDLSALYANTPILPKKEEVQLEEFPQKISPEEPALSKNSQEKEAFLEKKPKMPLPKEDLHDDDEEINKLDKEKSPEPKKPGKRFFKHLFFLSFMIISTGIALCGALYFKEDGRNSQEEKKIAAGVADIALALTHAKLNHMAPDKQNWLDPDFLGNILVRIIAPTLHTQAQINQQGQFVNYPYRLRVYMSKNMERFLVIAQPSPHLAQWFAYRKTIVIDSQSMEMRKIGDLKTLNRLLTNPHPLEDKNGEEITRVLKGSSLMSLSSLAGYENLWGFTPPKALGFIRPGAENYIYNAPRYYPFGEELLKKAIQLYQNPSSSTDVALLQEEMEEISKFSDIALYTSQGLQMAVEAQKALQTLAPHSRFLVAYVKFTPKGTVGSSHLLMNEDQEKLALLDSTHKPFSSFLNTSKHIEKDDFLLEEQDPLFQIEEPQETDNKHPLYLQLESLHSGRTKVLSALGNEIKLLLKQNNQTFISGFEKRFQELFQNYAKANRQQNKKIMRELTTLSQIYSETPLAELIKFVEKTDLISFAQEALNLRKQQLKDEPFTVKEIEKLFEKIEEAETLNALHDSVLELFNLLTLKNLPDLELLISHQNQMHEKVLKKLAFFLFSPSSPYASSPFEIQDRVTLTHILDHAWIQEVEERDYFLSEIEMTTQ